MPFFHMKIRHKLPLLAILLSVAPVLFLSVVMLNVNRDTSRQDYRMLLSNQAKASAQHLSSLYRAQKSGVVYASHLEIYREYLQVLRSGDTARAAVLRATIEDLQRIAVATDASISHVTLADAMPGSLRIPVSAERKPRWKTARPTAARSSTAAMRTKSCLRSRGVSSASPIP